MSDTVTVTALRSYTHDGEAHEEGETYHVKADAVDSLVGQGLVVRAEHTSEPVPHIATMKPAAKGHK
jgi:hypothetical protein